LTGTIARVILSINDGYYQKGVFMGQYYAAADIGASGGRVLLGRIESGILRLEEAHRFTNGFSQRGKYICWDIDHIFGEIITGLKKCGEMEKRPYSVGIDTWGVDYALVDCNGSRLGNCVAYRDGRTAGLDDVLSQNITAAELYKITGIAYQPFNTVYQLMAVKRDNPEILADAAAMLLMPEYLCYLLTGVKKHEYTIASTTGMVNALTRDWDPHVIRAAGLPDRIFGELSPPGTASGRFTATIKERVGYDCLDVLPCAHDTASAVLAAPAGDDALYLSSGTWSLLGAETKEPFLNEQSRLGGWTNEGGYGGTYRFLKNIMGLWMLQRVRAELGDKFSYKELADMAAEKSGVIIDVNDNRFLSPDNMINEIQASCRENGQPPPESPGAIARCIYDSLASAYAVSAGQIEKITGKIYSKIAVVGGGCQDSFLSSLTAKSTGKIVTAGPVEATAIGNILAQMISAGEISDVTEARALVRESFSVETINH